MRKISAESQQSLASTLTVSTIATTAGGHGMKVIDELDDQEGAEDEAATMERKGRIVRSVSQIGERYLDLPGLVDSQLDDIRNEQNRLEVGTVATRNKKIGPSQVTLPGQHCMGKKRTLDCIFRTENLSI